MNRILIAVTALALACCSVSVGAQDKKERKDESGALDEMMKKKLKNAQLVLDGIVTADPKKTASGAEELIQLANSTSWPLILSPQYEEYNADFIRSARRLVKKANDKNMDAAAMAYVEMTLSCVRCHQFVRDQKR